MTTTTNATTNEIRPHNQTIHSQQYVSTTTITTSTTTSAPFLCPLHQLPFQSCKGRQSTRGPHDAPTRVCCSPTQQKATDGGGGANLQRGRPGHKQLVQRHGSLKDVLVGGVEVERRRQAERNREEKGKEEEEEERNKRWGGQNVEMDK